MTRIALNIATVFATLTGLALLWEFRGAVLIFCMSLALAAAVRPAVEFFIARRWPVWLGVTATYLPLLAIMGLLIFLSVNRLGAEFNHMVEAADAAYLQINQRWRHGNPLERAIAQWLPSIDGGARAGENANGISPAKKPPQANNAQKSKPQPLNAPPASAAESAGRAQESVESGWEIGLVKSLFGLTLSVAGTVFDVLLIVVMSIYWSLDQVRFERLWLSLLSTGARGPARHVWRALETEIGKYLRSEFLQSVLAGMLLAAGYWLIGCPYPILLALLGAVVWLIPWIGVFLAVAALTITSLPGLITGSGGHWFLVLGGAILYTCTVFVLLEILVEPRLFDRKRYSMVLIAFVALSLAMVWGVFGLLIGPPLAVVMQVFGSYLFRRRLGLSDESEPSPAEVAARLAVLRKSLSESATPHPEVASMVDRLSALMDEVREELGPKAWRSGEKNAASRANRTGGDAPRASRSGAA